MKNTRIRIIIVFGSTAIIGIILFQVYWFSRIWTLEEKKFNQAVHIALKNVAFNIFQYNTIEPPSGSPVNQVSRGYYIVNVKSEIDANVLEYYLKTEFKKINLDVDFEYGIYDCQTGKMLYGDYICAADNCQESPTSNLPTYDKFTYYFGVNFPTANRHLLSEMSIWLVLSGLIFLVFIFFTYTIYIILKQKRLSEQQREFINNMTHEFKTPISSINIAADVLLNLEMLKNKDIIMNYARIIKQENNRLNNQVERVLNLARMEKKNFSLQKETFDLHELIENTVQNLRMSDFKKEKLDIITSLNSSSSFIHADKLHVTNILFNMFDNAIKYSSAWLLIEVKTEQAGDKIKLIFRDTGIGIKQEYHSKIFKKFYRIPTGNVHNVKGFGLGLYYVKKICRKHGWPVSFESEPGKGTSFQILIPAKNGK